MLRACAVWIVLSGCGGPPADDTTPTLSSGSSDTPPQTVEVTPPPSAGHALVYDDAIGEVLLVNAGLGGVSSPPQTDPTVLWAWNGERWRVLDGSGPPIRNLGGVAWDPVRDVLVLHGGTYSATVSYGDTWEWTFEGGWLSVESDGGPGVRDHTQMVWDGTKILLFGGQRDPTTFPADTWTWDGASWQTVATDGPPARVHHAMGYDAVASRVVVFGGFGPTGDLGDTWAWTGDVWEPLVPTRAPRSHGLMAFDERLGDLVLVGGIQPSDEVLALRADGWEPLGVGDAPSPRYLPGIAYDSGRGVLVVFGGGDPAGSALFADTWELDTAGWARRDP